MHAHTAPPRCCVAKADFKRILATRTRVYEAMLWLAARRVRQLYGLVGLNTLPLRARLAKQLLHLARSYGIPSLANGEEIRIGLQLAQEELAQLLGASRRRVNQGSRAWSARGPSGSDRVVWWYVTAMRCCVLWKQTFKDL